MKTKLLTCILLAALLLEGCTGETSTIAVTTETVETPLVEIEKEVRPRVYMSNDISYFSFPTSGYTVYIVGETHGNKESKQVFQAYLQNLYKDAGLRDVVLEEDQGYESDANAYVQGKTDVLPDGLCLRTDILGQIRKFNETLPIDEKVIVHLVDVDSPLSVVYKHLSELHTRLGANGASIPVPSLSEFETWSNKQIIDLVKELENVATDQPEIMSELETVYQSFRWYTMGNDMDKGTGFAITFAPVREDIITNNIQYLVTRLNGKPVLVFYGTYHGTKVQGVPNPATDGFKSWALRLVESGISVYSLSINGVSGNGYWRGESFKYGEGIDEYKFENGSSLVSLFETHPDTGILYTDLRTKENANVRLSSVYLDIPASQMYDGLIIFKKFTPMENTCGE